MNPFGSNKTALDVNGGWSRAGIRGIALAALVAGGIYLCYRLAQPCIPSLVWAGALALIFNPVHQYFESKVRNANMAAAFSGLLIGLLVVVPATWFAHKLAEQAISVPENIQKQIAAGKWHIDAGEHPLMAHLLARIEQQVSSPENASMATAWLDEGTAHGRPAKCDARERAERHGLAQDHPLQVDKGIGGCGGSGFPDVVFLVLFFARSTFSAQSDSFILALERK